MIKINTTPQIENFDLGIFGLGYESRAISVFSQSNYKCAKNIVIGYSQHTRELSYQYNKEAYLTHSLEIIEGDDSKIIKEVINYFDENIKDAPVNILLDITVMSRHRLSTIIVLLLDKLPKSSTLTIAYEVSKFVEAPTELSPIHKVGEITEALSGCLGDLSYPTSLIVGLGYEKGKAIGICNYIDAEYSFLFIPKGIDQRFEDAVIKHNHGLINSIPNDHIFYYNVCEPCKIYFELREIVLSIMEFSRPLLIPLGPKIFSAIATIIGKELYPTLPVWRVSSEHTEEPTERPSSGTISLFTVTIT